MNSVEHRQAFLLLRYWKEIKEDQAFPSLKDVNLNAMGELWNMCFVLDVSDKQKPHFHHFGSDLSAVFGEDYTGKTLGESQSHPVMSDIVSFMEEVWLMESPASHCGVAPTGKEGDPLLRYRSILAPLANGEAGRINYLIGTTNFREYE